MFSIEQIEKGEMPELNPQDEWLIGPRMPGLTSATVTYTLRLTNTGGLTNTFVMAFAGNTNCRTCLPLVLR